MADANEAIFGSGSGAPSFKFNNPGDMVVGVITHLDAVQSRKYGTNELEFWPSGDKLMIAIVTVATDLRDPAIEDDDGQRAVWVRGKNMNEAVRAATKDAGAKRLDVGGEFFMQFTGLGNAEKGAQPPKLYRAGYRKPTAETTAKADKFARKATDDPWANAPVDQGFTPPVADPWATPVPPTETHRAASVAAPAAPAAGGWPSGTPAASAPVQGAPAAEEWVTLPDGNKVNLTTLPPEAAALMRKMAGVAGASA